MPFMHLGAMARLNPAGAVMSEQSANLEAQRTRVLALLGSHRLPAG